MKRLRTYHMLLLDALTLLAILLVLAFSMAAQEAPACGKERWPVKTFADAGAPPASLRPMAATISDLTIIKAPNRKQLMAAKSTRFPEERQRFMVRALVIGFKLEADSDFHIVLADPDNPKVTMVAEMPSSECAPTGFAAAFGKLRTDFERQFGKATRKFKTLARPVPVFVTGQFFFDFIHGQTGVAPNGAELHPITAFQKN